MGSFLCSVAVVSDVVSASPPSPSPPLMDHPLTPPIRRKRGDTKKSHYLGVSWSSACGKWAAVIWNR